jgi:hypothetical protein
MYVCVCGGGVLTCRHWQSDGAETQRSPQRHKPGQVPQHPAYRTVIPFRARTYYTMEGGAAQPSGVLLRNAATKGNHYVDIATKQPNTDNTRALPNKIQWPRSLKDGNSDHNAIKWILKQPCKTTQSPQSPHFTPPAIAPQSRVKRINSRTYVPAQEIRLHTPCPRPSRGRGSRGLCCRRGRP